MGKANLLYAARLAAEGHSDEALKHIAIMKACLKVTEKKWVTNPYSHPITRQASPYILRVHDELGRLCDELEAAIHK